MLSLVVCAVLGTPPVGAQAASVLAPAGSAPAPGDSVTTVSLVTVSPGTSVASRFGHAALLVQQPGGKPTAWSFGQSGLDGWAAAATLIRGTLPDGARVLDADSMIAAQLAVGRDVRIQRLRLDSESAALLRTRLSQERGLGDPYDFFDANCTTRIRDLLDEALAGRLSATTRGVSAPWTLRRRVAGYTAPTPLLHIMVHSLLGTGADAPADRWAQMFLPETLADALSDASLVSEDRVLRGGVTPWTAPSPRAVGGTGWIPLGLMLGVLLVVPRPFGSVLGAGWCVLAGLAGLAVLALQVTALNPLMAGNLNGWLLNPAWLLVALGIWSRRPAPTLSLRLALAITLVSVGLWLAGVIGLADGVSGPLTAIVLPLHVGLTIHLWRRPAPRDRTPDPVPVRGVRR